MSTHTYLHLKMELFYYGVLWPFNVKLQLNSWSSPLPFPVFIKSRQFLSLSGATLLRHFTTPPVAMNFIDVQKKNTSNLTRSALGPKMAECVNLKLQIDTW